MAKKKIVERGTDGAPGQSGKAIGREVDGVRVFAEKVRSHKELESRWAILHEARVEYFRGKDFCALLRNHPDLKLASGEELPSVDDEEDLGNLLLTRTLIVRCDRVVKVVRPGKKKLSKWPARIELFPDQSFSEDDAFFAWTFERKRPLWQTVLSILLPVVTVACCLFPIFPHGCKLAALYSCLSFLTLIFGVLTLRCAIFGIMWILLGWRIWFFPNILADAATLSELLQFWPERKKDDQPPTKASRLVVTLVVSAIVWLCVHHTPDESVRARYRRRVSNIIDEVLVWKPNMAALNGRVEEAMPEFNETFLNTTRVEETEDVEEEADVGGGDDLQEHLVQRKEASEESDGSRNDLNED